MDRSTLPWEGGCRCGNVRVRVTKPPLLSGACHCTGCQRMTGSAFSLTLTVPGDGFEVTRGEPVIGGLHGPVAHHHHCPDCLSWVFTRAEGVDWFVNLRTTMLDDPSGFDPYVEFYAEEKLPWVTTPARRSYAKAPEFSEYAGLMQAFAEEAR
jgi:hypothetical protein